MVGINVKQPNRGTEMQPIYTQQMPPIYHNDDGRTPIFNDNIVKTLREASQAIEAECGQEIYSSGGGRGKCGLSMPSSVSINAFNTTQNGIFWNCNNDNSVRINTREKEKKKDERDRGQDAAIAVVSGLVFALLAYVGGKIMTQYNNFSEHAEKLKKFTVKYRQMSTEYGENHQHLNLLVSIGSATQAIFKEWRRDAKIKGVAAVMGATGCVIAGVGAAVGSSPAIWLGGGVIVVGGATFLFKLGMNYANKQRENERIRNLFTELNKFGSETMREWGQKREWVQVPSAPPSEAQSFPPNGYPPSPDDYQSHPYGYNTPPPSSPYSPDVLRQVYQGQQQQQHQQHEAAAYDPNTYPPYGSPASSSNYQSSDVQSLIERAQNSGEESDRLINRIEATQQEVLELQREFQILQEQQYQQVPLGAQNAYHPTSFNPNYNPNAFV